MDNAIVKKTIRENTTSKMLPVMLLSVMSGAVVMGCSQQADDVETVASIQEADLAPDYQASWKS